MFYTNVWLTVKNPADVDEIRGLLAQAARLSREEPGCQRFEVYQSEADRTRFLLCEHWEAREAWEKHRTGEAYTQIYQPQVLPRVERDPHPSTRVE